MLNVTLVYAELHRQFVIPLVLPVGACVSDAIAQSNIAALCPDLSLHKMAVGIFSQQVAYHTRLKTGDRVEIYRPLRTTPMEARRERARG